TENVLQLVEKWFLPIPSGQKPLRELPPEPEQKEPSREVVQADVPLNSIYIAFHAPGRTEEGYHVIDLISDLLSQGPSSRLYRCLVKEQEIFSEINAYQMGSIGPNLFVIEGKPSPHCTVEEAEEAIWRELELLKNEVVEAYELNKVKNKVESTMAFSEMAILDKAMNLAYFELLGDADMLNREVGRYLGVSPADIQELAQRLFRKENSSTLVYIATNDAG